VPTSGDALIDDLAAIQAYGREAAPDTFAGSRHIRAEGRNEAWFVGDLHTHRDALAQLLRRPDRLRILPARFSLARLQQVQEETMDAMFAASVEAQGFRTNASDIDEEANVVIYEVFTERPDSVWATIGSRYADLIKLDVLGPGPTEQIQVPWRCYEIAADGRTIRVALLLPSEDHVAKVAASETADSVSIAVTVDHWLGDTRLFEEEKIGTVTLTNDLGPRTVIDATTGEVAAPCRSSTRDA
jgi:hypothetical protein